jgi:hypothetical protein
MGITREAPIYSPAPETFGGGEYWIALRVIL